MKERLVHIGFGNYLSTERIVAIAVPGSAPIKRAVREAKKKDMAIDLTNGRRTKAVVFTDSQNIVLAALEPGTIYGRLADSAVIRVQEGMANMVRVYFTGGNWLARLLYKLSLIRVTVRVFYWTNSPGFEDAEVLGEIVEPKA